MPSTFTSRGRLNKQQTGENTDVWGGVLNEQVIGLLDAMVAGRVAFSLSGPKTLSVLNGQPDEARMAFIDVTAGTGGTITVPAVEKLYVVRNAASGDVALTTGSGASGVIRPGDLALTAVDGTNVRVVRALDFGAEVPRTTGTPTQSAHLTNKAFVDATLTAAKDYTDAKVLGGAVLPGGAVNGTLLQTVGSQAQWVPVNDAMPGRLRSIPSLITDWNTALENGWFASGPGNTNAPDTTRYWTGEVQSDRSQSWVRQVIWRVGDVFGETYTRQRHTNGTWSAWQLVPLTAAQQDARNDARYLGDNGLPDRLARQGRYTVDWNTARDFGLYFSMGRSNAGGSNGANSPDHDVYWMGLVVPYSDANWIVQTVWRVTAGDDPVGGSYDTFVRRMYLDAQNQQVWGPWRRQVSSLDALNSLFMRRDGSNDFTGPLRVRGVREFRAFNNPAISMAGDPVALFVNLPSGTISLADAPVDTNWAQSVTVIIWNGGSYSYNWPVTSWAWGQAPQLGVSQFDVVTLTRFYDSGSWQVFGFHTPMRAL